MGLGKITISTFSGKNAATKVALAMELVPQGLEFVAHVSKYIFFGVQLRLASASLAASRR